jgi:hypothetical protein
MRSPKDRTTMIGSPHLTSYDDREEERGHAETVAGQAHFVDIASLHTCDQCTYWRASKGKEGMGTCALFAKLTRGRKGAKPPPYRGRQRACRKWISNLGAKPGHDRDDGLPAPATQRRRPDNPSVS